ncbi:5'/3'-nucleotidase SurE [Alloprevotella sp. OH1205_COT-284]|uniref:5'/3'-nucleotidase SurE n=1 Tax=Alloprevotella sp. OH1205_COT-284 TaxID=2491043 RepID=UPI000F5F2D03|nr:5'/3'-nucleotidase SurE [Alloprevotella sp. OH1205_COT-284]RRD79788.1 5'/3'-nucleotidase SurE [Alloprevotella sp. OH1205_COT-284]
MSKPLILISNDDGYQAGGIRALIEALRPVADLLVVAPDGGRSGFGCAITSVSPIYNHLVCSETADDGRGSLELYACSGSPVDCVKLAFNILAPRLGRRPDLVVSGINHGDNSSVNTFYSGTMGAAFEGAHQGVPGIGFSLCDHHSRADFTPCIAPIQQIVRKVLAEGLPPFTTLNVNFPLAKAFKGIRMCRMARSRWTEELVEQHRPVTRTPYYWLTGTPVELEPDAPDTDRRALADGYIAITPQTLDVTHYGLLDTWTPPALDTDTPTTEEA